MSMTLWAESPEEVRSFLERIYKTEDLPLFTKIYVAKHSPISRSNKYTAGEYYKITSDMHIEVYDECITAPQGIQDLAQ